MGYHRAGFDVVGVDIKPQPHYPFEFHQADALEYLSCHKDYDIIHASPPCQAFSKTQRIRNNNHPDLITPLRPMLVGSEYVIENVIGAPLIDPFILCGLMFNLDVERDRVFETSFRITIPSHPSHSRPNAKMGRPPKLGDIIHVVGHFSNVKYARKAMGIDWMTREELRESIPPAYTEYIAREFISKTVVI